MDVREVAYRRLEVALPDPPYVLLKTGAVMARERWSVLGWDPWLVWTPSDGDDPLMALDACVTSAQREIGPVPALPLPLPLLMGAFSYDLAFAIESITPCAAADMPLPSMILYGFRRYVVMDERTQRGWEIALPVPKADAPFRSSHPRSASFAPVTRCPRTFSRATYCDAVSAIRTMIAGGDCYQVNLSHRYVVSTPQSAADLFRYACQHNPAPMMALIDTGTFQIISTSPERWLQRIGERCMAEPIKGTAARHADPRQDTEARAALLASEKNRAELAMIIDLLRNDLGRVAQTGSVSVEDPCRIASYTNVHHLVATIAARVPLATPWSALLRALFPGGSVTGCPKIQAMQVIEQLETVRRGFYCGAIGYIDIHGGGDWNIAIRTMTQIADQVIFHVGGGIVYDSDPAAEYDETLRKGETLFAALQVGAEDIM